MTEARPGSSRSAKIGRWLLAAAVAGAALAIGSVHTITLCIVTGVLAVAAVLTWWDAEGTTFHPRPAAILLLAVGAVLTTYTALQCVPMPIRWLATIAPHNADVWSRALSPLHEAGPAWAPISLDPTATRIEVLKGVAYLLAFAAALRVAQRREGIAFLSATVMATGGALALAAILHPAFGAKKLYGVFEPSTAFDRHLAPLLNPNNLSSYLNVAFCLALAAAISAEPRVPRPIAAAIAFLLATTQVWVASRGGVAAMVLCTPLVVLVSRASRLKQPRTFGIASILAGVGVAAGGIMAVLGSFDETSTELMDRDLSKLDLFRQAIRMFPAYPIWGIGRGAFESNFPAFRQSLGQGTFTHPENVIAQWLVEWGLLGGVGLVAIAVALRPRTAFARSSTAAGAWAGIVAVAVQNLADLGSEVPGLVFAPVLCAAIVVGGTAGRSTGLVFGWGIGARRTLAIAAACAAACAIAVATAGIGTELNEDRTTMRRAVLDADRLGDVDPVARASMLRHPGEPYLPFIVGWRAARTPGAEPVAWIGATLERAHVYGPAHLVLARVLSRRSPSQARMEYRVATEQVPELVDMAAREGSRLVRDFYDALELVADGKAGPAMVDALDRVLEAPRPATCARLDDELATRASADPLPWLHRASAAVTDLEAGEAAPWCQDTMRERCVTLALETSARAEQISPSKCEPYILHARARILGGDTTEGLTELSSAADIVHDRVECLQALVIFANQAHDDKRSMEANEKIAASGCTDDAECARSFAWIAQAELNAGRPRQAFLMFKRASGYSPDDDHLLELVAQLAATSGLHTEAAESYRRLAEKHPAETRWQRAASDEHDAALKAAAYDLRKPL
jgi:O-Antigen ligase